MPLTPSALGSEPMSMGAVPSGGRFDSGNRRLTPPRLFAILLLCLGLSLAATSCDAQIDGGQWVDVTVTNATVKSVTLDTHPARSLSPGQKTVLNVNSNNDPQAVRVKDAEGRVLGCLVFPLHTDLPEMRSASVSDLAACAEKVHSFPG